MTKEGYNKLMMDRIKARMDQDPDAWSWATSLLDEYNNFDKEYQSTVRHIQEFVDEVKVGFQHKVYCYDQTALLLRLLLLYLYY